jgi:hypothetical protein
MSSLGVKHLLTGSQGPQMLKELISDLNCFFIKEIRRVIELIE